MTWPEDMHPRNLRFLRKGNTLSCKRSKCMSWHFLCFSKSVFTSVFSAKSNFPESTDRLLALRIFSYFGRIIDTLGMF